MTFGIRRDLTNDVLYAHHPLSSFSQPYSSFFSSPSMDIEKAGFIISNGEMPIAKRMRALFYLRNIETAESAKSIARGLGSASVLLKHEVAYVLGQMCVPETVDILMGVLADEEENEIVRHEAGEALGNYPASERIMAVLKRYSMDGSRPVAETCQIALEKMKEGRADVLSVFGSRDPAFPFEGSFGEARRVLLDRAEPLYRRYQAMFYMRDLGTDEAIEALGAAMEDDSALLKHEISFVFGQLRNEASVPYLMERMDDEEEHEMVRHECAEALGIIGSDESLRALVKFLHSKCDILRESVEVAVDIHGFVTSDEVEYCTI
jgi:deoxyhypusine monooxygenase